MAVRHCALIAPTALLLMCTAQVRPDREPAAFRTIRTGTARRAMSSASKTMCGSYGTRGNGADAKRTDKNETINAVVCKEDLPYNDFWN